ncbi:PSD1 and planctomycete cytochrome C domain-containing protein [Stieleria mannarensis]|uniref:PSD1 and planctomycete cytochrome C domain-containing protein n=1 Tax=Stieleria mannarensis TaxID=2755585 RepID=UPI001600C80A|nr:PSD1 and planctomycete cytochrome C domain-containing protein [Rhodopirellula sp. JC639]
MNSRTHVAAFARRWISHTAHALATVATSLALLAQASVTHADDVSFSRDVLPVLSDRCFHCHGPDESNREAGLRLDVEEHAKEDRGGYAAIVPGNLEDSELWRRITTDDEYEVMPPTDSHRKPLTESERAAIREWILSGATWGKHWSLEVPTRPEPPAADRHPIDAFIESRLAGEGFSLSGRAAPHTQLKRLTLDLTGLSPTPQDVADFDGSDQAWNDAIDRLLQSPRNAERMAMWWLDAARYSDSDGFQQDATRQNWPWRDWVIRQFRDNKSFRDFTIEQFAGDLLPDATEEQILATCFHRNHMTNGEGGRDPEESRIDYVIDRINTTGTVWLGLTLGCVQCHSHKFDPISHQDYYSLSAFFNSIDEDGKAGMNAKPYLEYTSPHVQDRIDEMASFVQQCEAEHERARQSAERRFDDWLHDRVESKPADHQVWWTPTPGVSSSEGTLFRVEADQTVQTHGPKPTQDDYRVALEVPTPMEQVSGFRIEVLPDDAHVEKRFTRDGNGEFTLTSVLAMVRRQGSPSEIPLELRSVVADVEADEKRDTKWDQRYAKVGKTLNDDARDGWTTEGVEKIEPHVAVYQLATPWQVRPGDQFVILLRQRSTHGRANIGRFKIALAAERGETVRRVDGDSPIAELVRTLNDGNQVDEALRKRLLAQYLLGDADYQAVAKKRDSAKKQLADLKNQAKPRKVMVLAEREKPRETHILVRGVWDAKGETVQRAVLPSVLDWPATQATSRLDLARWIVDSENPLTARVAVNHLWQIMFGQGLVRTPGDFGLQGELPTHPRLLDWLAVELIQSDWDLQHILRLIATSETYRQSSVASAELLASDPDNRLLARAPRFRLPAWMIRDNALHVSGLLSTAVGGPPVRPYQPEGVWAEITMGRFDYQPSVGPAQYRRTVYAFWRRSSAPTFLFDSAQRRVCEVGVRRTNTPLHALTLLNDVSMLEASRALADAVVGAEDQVVDGRLQNLAMRVLSRELSEEELAELKAVLDSATEIYDGDPKMAVEYCTVGQQSPPRPEFAPQTAAWMTVASLLLNLDEAMTRE